MERNLAIEQIISHRLEGLSSAQIKEASPELASLSDQQFSLYHWQAGNKIREIQESEVLSTRVLHAQRYELLYQWFLEHDFDNYAMKMLEASERLLGLHSNTVGISIHNLIEKKKTPNIYDHSKLTDVELIRLKSLLEKAQR